jgi:hypothetical protein
MERMRKERLGELLGILAVNDGFTLSTIEGIYSFGRPSPFPGGRRCMNQAS